MSKKHSSNFVIGILLGAMAGLLFWYWQKSTSAEDGALDLLDRLAAAEARLRALRADLGKRPSESAIHPDPDNLETVRGIGPVFAGRLQNAGIATFSQLAALTGGDLADILQVNLSRAGAILAETRLFLMNEH